MAAKWRSKTHFLVDATCLVSMADLWHLILSYVHVSVPRLNHKSAIELFVDYMLYAPVDEEYLQNPLALVDFIKGLETIHGGSKHSSALERVYGEITARGVTELSNVHLEIQPTDVFYDLGSGFGRMSIQVFLASQVSNWQILSMLEVLSPQKSN